MRILPTLAATGLVMVALTACASAVPPTTGPSTSSRGTIVEKLGQAGGFGKDAAHVAVSFTIDSIRPVSCDNPDSTQPPRNGHFMAAHMRLSTAPGADLSTGVTGVSSMDFSFVGSRGVTAAGSPIAGPATFSCLKHAELFPSVQFAPGSQYEGDLVFDLPAVHGALIYNPGLTNASGWEWDF